MKLYPFQQNNSGGFYDKPAQNVLIAASSASEANELAQALGIYFDGCANDIDCNCCGDRWSRADETDVVNVESIPESLHINRDDYSRFVNIGDNQILVFDDNEPALAVFVDGTVTLYKVDNDNIVVYEHQRVNL